MEKHALIIRERYLPFIRKKKEDITIMNIREGKRERVYADSTYQVAFPILIILSFILTFLVFRYAITAAADGEGGAWLVVLLVGACILTLPFGFVSMWKQLYYYWDFLAEGIRAPKQGRLLAAVKPYSLYKYICVGYYRHGTLTSFGAKRFFLLISVYPIPADLLKKVNSLECSAELVKIKITRNNMRKISRYLPTGMKLKVKSVLKAAGLNVTIGGN